MINYSDYKIREQIEYVESLNDTDDISLAYCKIFFYQLRDKHFYSPLKLVLSPDGYIICTLEKSIDDIYSIYFERDKLIIITPDLKEKKFNFLTFFETDNFKCLNRLIKE